MFSFLIYSHSFFRWLVLVFLILAIWRSARGYFYGTVFSATDNRIRHWTATVLHIQLVIGMLLYFKSPVVNHFWGNAREDHGDFSFFALIHSTLMFTAVIMATLGSSFARRKPKDSDKFKTMLVWFALALTVILIAIPWPFSPLASRPYIR